MFIEVEDETTEKFYMDIEKEQLELYPWIVLNLNEIGISIAYQLFDAEYQITQEILDEEINDYLLYIHERLLDKAIQTLEDNGIDVL